MERCVETVLLMMCRSHVSARYCRAQATLRDWLGFCGLSRCLSRSRSVKASLSRGQSSRLLEDNIVSCIAYLRRTSSLYTIILHSSRSGSRFTSQAQFCFFINGEIKSRQDVIQHFSFFSAATGNRIEFVPCTKEVIIS